VTRRGAVVLFAAAVVVTAAAAAVHARRAGPPSGAGDVSAPAGLELVAVPGGTFLMGAGSEDVDARADERPRHRVTVSPFLMAATEVTQGLYREVTGETPSYYQIFQIADTLPVERVTWHEAVRFCNALSERDGLPPAYVVEGGDVGWLAGSPGYRLPTEAEWEYACRAGTAGPFATGVCLGDDAANYDGSRPYAGCERGLNRGQPLPVASFPPNAFGLYDLHGNVNEWCWDRYGPYPPGAVRDPIGPRSGAAAVVRGGGWQASAWGCRCSARFPTRPDYRADFIGFRVVRNLGPDEAIERR
jgi:formylglycine-generating enzyme required for sulfatase activity